MIRPAIHKVVSSEQGLSFLPVLTSKLRALEATTTGVISQTFRFPCGVRGRIFSSPEYRKIEIWQDPPAIVCGMVHGGFLRYENGGATTIPSDPPPFFGDQWNPEDADMGDGEERTKYAQVFWPTAGQATRDGSDTQAWQSRSDINLVPDPPQKMYLTNWKPTQVSLMRASMFTGEMRKVVQVLLGMNIEVEYEYSFLRSHGIWTGADDSKWLIEVSSYDGVRAMRLNGCPASGALPGRDGLRLKKELGWIPQGESFRDKDGLPREDVVVVELLPASGMEEFYKWGAFFNDCGWAFSSDGHRAVNTAQGQVFHDNVWVNSGHLFELAIAGGETPTSATLQQTAEGLLGSSPSRIHVPGLFGHFSVDMRTRDNDANRTVIPHPINCSAPFFAFFVNDEVQVVTYNASYGSLENTSYADAGLTAIGLPTTWAGLDDSYEAWSSLLANITHGFTTTLGGATQGTWKDGIVERRTFSAHGTLGGIVSSTYTGAGPGLGNNHDLWTCRVEPGHVSVNQHWQACILPYGDRESFYLFTGDHKKESRYTWNLLTGVVVWGKFQETSGVLPPNYTYALVGGEGRTEPPAIYIDGINSYFRPIFPATFYYTTQIALEETQFYSAIYPPASTVVDEGETRTVKASCFIAGEMREFQPRLWADVPLLHYPYFTELDMGFFMNVRCSAFTDDHKEYLFSTDFNQFEARHCVHGGELPYSNTSTAFINYVGVV